MNCLNTIVVVLLSCPNFVCASDLRAFSLGAVLVFMFATCSLKVIIVSYVIPKILGLWVWVSCVLFRVT